MLVWRRGVRRRLSPEFKYRGWVVCNRGIADNEESWKVRLGVVRSRPLSRVPRSGHIKRLDWHYWENELYVLSWRDFWQIISTWWNGKMSYLDETPPQNCLSKEQRRARSGITQIILSSLLNFYLIHEIIEIMTASSTLLLHHVYSASQVLHSCILKNPGTKPADEH